MQCCWHAYCLVQTCKQTDSMYRPFVNYDKLGSVYYISIKLTTGAGTVQCKA